MRCRRQFKLRTTFGGARQARAIVQRMGDAREPQQQATVMGSPPQKINLISCGPMVHVSDIKLIRTDTTLDLSQKAEKGMISIGFQPSIYRTRLQSDTLCPRCGTCSPN